MSSNNLKLNDLAGQNFANIDIDVHLFIEGCWLNVPRGHSGLDNLDEPDQSQWRIFLNDSHAFHFTTPFGKSSIPG